MQHERDNPKMCKPMEPIPMPYKDDCAKVELVEFKIKRPYDWHEEFILENAPGGELGLL